MEIDKNLEEIETIRTMWAEMMGLLSRAWQLSHSEKIGPFYSFNDFKRDANRFKGLYYEVKTLLEKFGGKYQINVPIIFEKSEVTSLYDLVGNKFANIEPTPIDPATHSPVCPELKDIKADQKVMDLFFEECIYKLKGDSLKPTEELSTLDEAKDWYNYKDNSLFFYGKLYKPRKESQAKIIRSLVMRHQEENNKGTVLKEGKRVPEEVVVAEASITLKEFRNIKKQLIRTLKKFPLKIDSNSEGILLILTKQ